MIGPVSESPPARHPGRTFHAPSRNCDVVMKGGVTSGIVYPSAICELAQTHRFRAIGGTSAGAIAAAVTAAAEHRRQTGGGDHGFRRMERLPTELGRTVPGGNSRLFSLFRPQSTTRPLFDVLTAALRTGSRGGNEPQAGILGKALGTLLRCGLPALRHFPGAAMVGLVPSVVAGLLEWWTSRGQIEPLRLFPALALALICVPLFVAAAVFRALQRELPRNFYGLCRGYEPNEPPGGASLTSWLAALLEDASGKPVLTFGDLWGTHEEPRVKLQMITTNLNHGRPYRLPFEEEDETLFHFNASELEQFFPAPVVAWMIEKSGAVVTNTKHGDLHRLPAARDLPVVVATRLSLSFPGLVSAIPLYAVGPHQQGPQRVDRCWFSDGGIASNFPVHFFDAPLPRWPTFAINLREHDPDHPSERVRAAGTNHASPHELWSPLNASDAHDGSLVAFIGSIVNCLRNWSDSTQAALPGYRDRVAEVLLRPGEGGLNLKMTQAQIDQLAEPGAEAATLLMRNFSFDRPAVGSGVELSWDNHRWIRYRTTMALMEPMLHRMRVALGRPTTTSPTAGELRYDTLIRLGMQAPSHPPRSIEQQLHMIQETDALLALAARWDQQPPGERFADGAPRPAPELRVRPRI